MSVASIKAGQAFYEILAEDKTGPTLKAAEAGLMRLGARIAGVGAALSGVAAAGIGALGALVKSFAGAGDDLADAMSTTGLSSDFLQSLKFAAADAGVSVEGLLGGIGKMSKLLVAAASGNKAANATLAQLGLTIEGLAGMTQDQRFAAFADAISRIEDPAQRAAAAMAVFGKSGAKLMPVLEGGAEGLAKMQADMAGRGLILSEKDIALAAEANGAFLMLSATFEHIKNLIGAAVAPVFLEVAKVVQAVSEEVAQFINNNRQLFAGVTIGLGILGGLGLVLMAVGGAIALAGAAIGGLATAFSVAAAAVGVLLSPVGIIIAAIAACGVAALVSAYYLDQLFNGGAALKFLQDAAMGAWNAIKLLWSAISNGRWDLAGRLIGDGLRVGFYGAILAIKEAWHNMTIWLVESIAATVSRIEGMLPEFAQFGIGGKADALVGAMRAAGEARLADDRQNAAGAVGDLAKTVAAIRQVALDAEYAKNMRKNAAAAKSIPLAIEQASILTSANGATLSSNAARLAFAAPANESVQEKQLEAQNQMVKLLGGIQDGVEGIEGLAVE